MPKGRQTPHAVGLRRATEWWWLPLLATIVGFVYLPAWHGTLLWDDGGHLIPAGLRTANGLWRIWFELGTTQQYYPVAYSIFWAQARLWGDHYIGYHLVSIALHASSAFGVLLILRRLAVPGAALAAVLFALHPVHVESVAWMSELKNTLSGVLFLGSGLLYLAFDDTRRWRSYSGALALYACALLSKSVTATLPAGMLVIIWWRRGRLEWRRDTVPLLPFFAVGGAAAVMTSWFEKTFVGAYGSDFSLTLIERVLVAGRATLFYLGKLAWPSPLIFMYERWAVSQTVWWQYAYPLACVGLVAGAWSIRRWSRAPLAGLLFFLVTLSPALGFVDVYPFRYSYVADHFQYLASLGVLTVAAAAAVTALERRGVRRAEPMLITFAAMLLGVLTWHQSALYRDAETLYRVTLERNPAAWLAQNNLATLIVHRSRADQDEALRRYEEATRLNPADGMLRDNFATTLAELGRLPEALEQQREAVRLSPRYPTAHVNLGVDFQNLGRFSEAIDAYRAALALDPTLRRAQINLGLALAQAGEVEESLALLRAVAASDPADVEAHVALADVLGATGRSDEAEREYTSALARSPDDVRANVGLAAILINTARAEQARSRLETALRTAPGDPVAKDMLSSLQTLTGAGASRGRNRDLGAGAAGPGYRRGSVESLSSRTR
jgi:tetratricopeptide (TPR) repeat protein